MDFWNLWSNKRHKCDLGLEKYGFLESLVKLGTQICDISLKKDGFLESLVKQGTQICDFGFNYLNPLLKLGYVLKFLFAFLFQSEYGIEALLYFELLGYITTRIDSVGLEIFLSL